MMSQRGQVLLIALLVLAVATTIVLALIARSSTDLSISNQIAESSSAFNAAEAGIEQALKSGVIGVTSGSAGGIIYNTTVSTVGSGSQGYVFPKKTTVESVETVWLVPHVNGVMDESASTYTTRYLRVCWGKETPDAALMVSVWYKNLPTLTYRVARQGIDPSPNSRSAPNNFNVLPDGSNGCGTTLDYYKDIDFYTLVGSDLSSATGDRLLFVRIQPLYSDASVAVASGDSNPLPAQGNRIESAGTVNSGVIRKVVVYRQYKAPAPIFDNVIYSQGTFSQ